MDFKQCSKCKKTYLKALAFDKRARICNHCKGKACAVRALEDG